nr:unnamed protein product [Digitaria exilis]
MTPLTTLRTAQLFQMSCPLISSAVGIRIGSTAAAWLDDSPPAPAPAADGSGEAMSRYLVPFPPPLAAAAPQLARSIGEWGWSGGEDPSSVSVPPAAASLSTPSSKKRVGASQGIKGEAGKGIRASLT